MQPAVCTREEGPWILACTGRTEGRGELQPSRDRSGPFSGDRECTCTSVRVGNSREERSTDAWYVRLWAGCAGRATASKHATVSTHRVFSTRRAAYAAYLCGWPRASPGSAATTTTMAGLASVAAGVGVRADCCSAQQYTTSVIERWLDGVIGQSALVASRCAETRTHTDYYDKCCVCGRG